MSSKVKNLLIIALWIGIWAVAALSINSPLILASPLDVCQSAIQNAQNPVFWISIALTFVHIFAGLVGACVAGCLLAFLSWRLPPFKDFIMPAMQFIKSAPIVCFIVLILVWVGSTYVDIIAVVFAVLPAYYFAMYEGYEQRDKNMIDMLKLFNVAPISRFLAYEWPSTQPYFHQATKTGVGMSWKAGVTAELIGVTFHSAGEAIYMSKLSLDTACLFLWMFVVIVLGWLSEKLVLIAMDALSSFAKKQLMKRLNSHGINKSAATLNTSKQASQGSHSRSVAACIEDGLEELSTECKEDGMDGLSTTSRNSDQDELNATCTGDGQEGLDATQSANREGVLGDKPDKLRNLRAYNISKSYGKRTIVSNFSHTFEPKSRTCLMHSTGSGKTTLTSMLMGLLSPDSGNICPQHPSLAISAEFQETRLIPYLSVVQNIMLAANISEKHAKEGLQKVIKPEYFDAKVSELSGGMKRSVELWRALAAESECVVLDEPFTGMDEKTKQRAYQLVEEKLGDRILILITHDEEDCEALGCEYLDLDPVLGQDPQD